MSLSLLNRYATATRADVGTAKATCLKKYFEKIYLEVDVDVCVVMYEEDVEDELFGVWGGDGCVLDFVVDCIDNIDIKVDFFVACARRGLRVVIFGGVGVKCDLMRLWFVDIVDCVVDFFVCVVWY